MDNQQFQTLKAKRPLPNRPVNGFAAWQSTLGYIARHYNQDAVLSVTVHCSNKGSVGWGAMVSWGNIQEVINDQNTLSDALSKLWAEVENKHTVFDVLAESPRRPVGYKDDEWLDSATQETFQRLIWAAQTVFIEGWHISFDYRPIEDAARRVEMTLVASQPSLRLKVEDSTLLSACRNLFRCAVPIFAAQSGIVER